MTLAGFGSLMFLTVLADPTADAMTNMTELTVTSTTELLDCASVPSDHDGPCRGSDPCEKRKKPRKPHKPAQYNGIDYPGKCLKSKKKAHFFSIGDWGGMCNYVDGVCKGHEKIKPMANRHGKWVAGVDDGAQQRVAREMVKQAKKTPPEFVLSVGDQFYPGGVDAHCGTGVHKAKYQFKHMYEDMYPNASLPAEWWLLLGNHDYGGVCYTKAWDQQIYYTWEKRSGGSSHRWIMPAQYWKRRVQFDGFVAEFFFLDQNYLNAQGDDNHNICSAKHSNNNPGSFCPWSRFPAPDGRGASCNDDARFHSPSGCHSGLHELWAENKAWLIRELDRSDADWQIIVSHYPIYFSQYSDYTDWGALGKKYGIDLFISGHTHLQEINEYGSARRMKGLEGFPDVICGGGGGVTSEATPHADGHDMMYGFMDYVISKDEMTITSISHKGIRMKTATIKPRGRGDSGSRRRSAPATSRRRSAPAHGCCSWASNNACGQTTDYCKGAPDHCVTCGGHWVPFSGVAEVVV